MTEINKLKLITPNWPAPEQVMAICTTRIGGVSQGVFQGLNTATHVGDVQENVARNRDLLNTAAKLPCTPGWLNQTHSTHVADLGSVHTGISPSFQRTYPSVDLKREYDASFLNRNGKNINNEINIPCAIQTADCVPILLTDKGGTWVAAIHAGWRGLLAGVIENTLSFYQKSTDDLVAWIGPCIRQEYFEVGLELKEQFAAKNKGFQPYFLQSEHQYFADLAGMATYVLQQHKVDVYDSKLCSYADPKQFYSYRRDGITGRMASVIWIK